MHLTKKTTISLCLIYGLVMTGKATAHLNDGLIAHYPLDNHFQNVIDSSSLGDGYIPNDGDAPTPIIDPFGFQGYQFDGNDVIRLPDRDYWANKIFNEVTFSIRLFPQTQLEICSVPLWVVGNNTESFGAANNTGFSLTSCPNASNMAEQGFSSNVGVGRLSNASFNTAARDPNGYPGLNEWHTVTGMYQGATTTTEGFSRIYIDGQLKFEKIIPTSYSGQLFWGNSSTFSGLVQASIGATRLEADRTGPWRYFFKGIVDDVRIYDRTLSGIEVQQLHDSYSLDLDLDGIADIQDNCPTVYNPLESCTSGSDCLGSNNSCNLTNSLCALQNDNDGDSTGDACDLDDDNDGVSDTADNCPINANSNQADDDYDGLGNACDAMFDDGSVAAHIDQVASTIVQFIIFANPPGGNGMINKLTGNAGVTQRVANAVTSFAVGLIDVNTYLSELTVALDKLDDFDDQLNAKINNGQIQQPQVSQLLDASAEIRLSINSLIANI